MPPTQHNCYYVAFRKWHGSDTLPIYNPYVSRHKNAKRTADFFRCPIWMITGAARPFENPLPVFYLNGEALGWFGLFLPSLSLKQFFVHQTCPPEVMNMRALTISVEETNKILPSACK